MPKSFQHNVSLIGGGQDNFAQCWLASYKMLFQYYNESPSTIEERLKNGGIDVEDSKKNGLLDTDFSKAALSLGLHKYSGVKYKAAPTFFDVGLTDGCEAFLELLKSGPLWVSRYVGNKLYHIVVATGYDDSGSGYIIHNNPFTREPNAKEVRDLTANVFVKHITNAMGSIQAHPSILRNK